MNGRVPVLGHLGGAGADSPLVPIADRVRYLNAYRLIAVSTVVTAWLLLPGIRTMTAGVFSWFVLGYLALSMASALVWRLPRALALRLFAVSLLLDGIFLAVVSSTADGIVSPLRYLVFLHLVTVALLASFRTGLKLAMWHSLLVGMDVQLRQAGFFGGFDTPTAAHRVDAQVVVLTLAFALTALTTGVASAVNERELRRRTFDLQALATLAWRLENQTDPMATAKVLVDAVADDFAIKRVMLLQAGGRPCTVLASTGLSPDGGIQHDPANDGLVRDASSRRETLLVRRLHPQADPWLAAVLPDATNVALVPLHAEGHTVGVLICEYGIRRGSRIEHRVIAMIERFASQTALALANAWLLDHIKELASTDGLTKVLNRRSFDERLSRETARATSGGTPLTALLIDIDHFKAVNDTHGHATGDEVLRIVAQTISLQSRPGDTVARYGGEELAVLLPNTTADTAAAVAERIRAAIAAIAEPVPVTVSIGCATLPFHCTDSATLVEAADEALYRAKRSGRNQVATAVGNWSLSMDGAP